jgi:hypothetical protein
MGAIETTGILNTQGQIQLDHPIPQEKDRFVRVILLMSEDELKEKNWLDTVSHNPSFAFLHDPEEVQGVTRRLKGLLDKAHSR